MAEFLLVSSYYSKTKNGIDRDTTFASPLVLILSPSRHVSVNTHQSHTVSTIKQCKVKMAFLDGSLDVITHILSFCEPLELDDLVLVSRDFYRARTSPLLEQTKTGTIRFCHHHVNQVPVETFQRWNRVIFQGTRSRLVAVIDLISPPSLEWENHTPIELTDMRLDNVRELIIQPGSSLSPGNTRNAYSSCVADNDTISEGRATVTFLIKTVCPNLQVLNLGSFVSMVTDVRGLSITPQTTPLDHVCLQEFCCCTPTGDGASLPPSPLVGWLCVPRIAISRKNNNAGYRHQCTIGNIDSHRLALRRLHLGPVFFFAAGFVLPSICDGEDETISLFQEYPNLEHVTIKNARIYNMQRRQMQALPQNLLIHFVRHAPNLQLFRSDLTNDNIAMLKQERPEVTLVNY